MLLSRNFMFPRQTGACFYKYSHLFFNPHTVQSNEPKLTRREPLWTEAQVTEAVRYGGAVSTRRPDGLEAVADDGSRRQQTAADGGS